MSALVVERVTTLEGLTALGPEWRALEATSGNTLPFRTFAWVSAWWTHLHEDRLAVKDTLAIRAVRAEGGRLVCVAPMILTERPAVGPLRLGCLQLVGADPNVTEVRGAICEPNLAGACHAAICEDLDAGGEVDCVRWAGLTDAACGAFQSSSVQWSDGSVCYILSLPSTWEELLTSRPRNLKESVRKCYNSLRRDGLTHELEVVRGGDGLAAALEDFLRLHAARAALDGTVRHKNVFEHPRCRAFLVDVCGRVSEQGNLRILRLRVGGQLVATRIGFALGDTLYLYYSGFDPAFARYGVMTTTVAEALKYAIREGFSRVNLSTGNDESKLRWRPEPMAYRNATVTSSSALGQAKYRTATFLEHAAREFGMDQLLGRRRGVPVTSRTTG